MAGSPVRPVRLDYSFARRPENFAALFEAMRFLGAMGFSVGPLQRGAPAGIMFGSFVVAKWRNLSPADRSDLDGRMTGDARHGPIAIRFRQNLSAEALAALSRVIPAAAAAVAGEVVTTTAPPHTPDPFPARTPATGA